jgi:alpha,alpha-trehalose phosphorylase
VLAAEVGHLDLAYQFLGEAALMDLQDLEHNTRDGLHMAALAGSWLALVAGFGGMRDHGGHLSFAPRLPDQLNRLAFNLAWQGEVLSIKIDAQHAVYAVLPNGGKTIDLLHHGESVRVSAGKPVTMKIPALKGTTARPPQPATRLPKRRH